MFSALSKSVIVYVIISSAKVVSQSVTVPVTSSAITTGGITTTSENKTIVLLPKCCPQGFSVGLGNCSKSTVVFQPSFDVHMHNDTAYDDVPIDASSVTFQTYVKDPCKDGKLLLRDDDGPIFLANGSVLIGGMGEYDGLLGHDQFCIDNLNTPDDNVVYTFLCVKNDDLAGWVISSYITFMIISALLFSASAIFFYQQDVQAVNKKSFMAYATSMSATYLIIILMQFISGGCKFFGLLLQFFVVLAFCWLAVLCFDLAWSLHVFGQKENVQRIKYYIGSTTLISSLFLILSMINGFTPDLPYSFFKPQFKRTSCEMFDNQRTPLFFFAIILTLGVSISSLCYSLVKMNHNRYGNTVEERSEWRKVSKKYSYMYGRKLVVFVTMLIWILDAFTDRLPPNSSISIIIITVQAFHGFIVVPLYTMKTLRRVIEVNKQDRIDTIEDLLRKS